MVRDILYNVKKVVSLVLKFFLFFLISLVFLAFVYMLNESCSLLCAGQDARVFLFQPFLKGLVELAPFAGILALLLSFQVLVRHRWRNVISLACMICLAVLVFAVIIPVSFGLKMNMYELSNEHNAALQELHKDVIQTPGYFRTTSNGTYYYTAIDHNYTASGVYQPVYQMEKKVFETFKHSNLQFSPEDTRTDLLIKNELDMPVYISLPISALKQMSDYAYKMYNHGWLPYLCVASIVLALFALWGISFVSSWPLLSVFLMIVSFVGVMCANYFALCTQALMPAKMFINEWLSSDTVSLVFPILLNLLLLLVGSVIGLIAHLLRKKRNFGAEL